ncbi:hypothetical protein N7539_003635 [Penicillium diatomitis]|uniref:Ketoreductase domain-containing protein n=1 Tax=Penicillium diatomitis TaxID=2819901 RepID=A0A9W9XC95_9EURO|nr:uncharacterized protein N7539_003635 [Penicillium diatomitis]KAJ5488745.1 hypothetical protein N7539_003635 [Penicillium diatomitis]
MGRSLKGTVIITGGNGSLGSEIAIAIAKTQPFTHLLLTARDPSQPDARDLTERIRLIGPRSIEILRLDLADLQSVHTFALQTIERVRTKEIPPIHTLIHSAATASYTVDEPTVDGYDPVYQTNCMAPFLLTVSLLEAFRAGGGTAADGGAKVIYVGCAEASNGRLDYFDHDREESSRSVGTVLSKKEASLRFGSSKLLASVALYALRRSLASTTNISLDVFTMDPGVMVGDSHLRTGTPLSVKVAQQTRSGLGPILRMMSRSAVNKASVPAKAIAKVAFRQASVEQAERYFILDDEYEAASVLRTLHEGAAMERLLLRMMQQTDGSAKNSPASMSPTPMVF